MSRSAQLVLVLVGVCWLVVVHSKQLSRCELVTELRRHGFPEQQMRDWVCLVEAESSGRTNKKSRMNKNGSYDYGLFQINDRYWCSNTDRPGKDCRVRCDDLLSDDITAAADCAKKVYQRHGFRGWYGWRSKCQGALPDITSC